MSIWIPSNVQEAIDMAHLLNPKAPHDILLLHASFGHHFGGDMGLVMAQGYVLKGKACLSADAMAGIARRSGLVDYITIVDWGSASCTMEVKRIDEERSHTFTFDLTMAQAQGLTRNRNWQTMPRQMLRARCMTMALRAVFPDAVSGLYSADEIADHSQMNDTERTAVAAQSLGEEMPSRSSQAVRPPHQPQGLEQRYQESQAQSQQVAQPALVRNELYDFNNPSSVKQFMEDWGVDTAQAAAALDGVNLASTEDKEAFSYGKLSFMGLISTDHPRDWYLKESAGQIHNDISAQYGALASLNPRWYGPRTTCGPFMEVMKAVSCFTDEQKIQSGLELLKAMNPMDWGALKGLERIKLSVSAQEVDQHKAKPSQEDREAQRLEAHISSDQAI